MRLLALAIFLAATSAIAQTAHTGQPYRGEEGRRIAALSDQQIDGLRTGAGLGYAKAAELNGWPGPAHVLELTEALDLSAETREAVEAIRSEMLSDTVPLGEALIAAEAELDALFARGDPDTASVEAATARAAAIEAKLRAVHLSAHLATTPLLTPHQRMVYAAARGYRGSEAHGHGSGH